jgi:hypothetical protein
MSLDISPKTIIGIVVLFVIIFNAGILVSFFRNKGNNSPSAFGKLIQGGKVNFHKDKENIDELSQLLSELKNSEEDKE